MTFRERINQQISLAPTVFVGGISVLIPVGAYLWMTERYIAQSLAWSCGFAALLAVASFLQRIRCPRCNSKLPWTPDRVARDYAIRGCSRCGVEFDVTALRSTPSGDTTIPRAA